MAVNHHKFKVKNGLSSSGDATFGDNNKIILGAGSDLTISHDTTGTVGSYITESGTGSLNIRGNNIIFANSDGSLEYGKFFNGAGVEFNYADSTKLATTNTGVDITGVLTTDGITTSADINFGNNDKAIFGAGSDLQIYHDGSHSYIVDNGTGNLYAQADNYLVIRKNDGSKTSAWFNTDAEVELRYNDSLKFATTSTGVEITGNASFADNGKALFGTGSDLQIYHDGANSRIQEQGTGNLIIRASSGTYIQGVNGENGLAVIEDGTTTAYYDGVAKLATTSTGVNINGTLTVDDITLSDASTPTITLTDTTNTLTTFLQSGNSTAILGTSTAHDIRFQANSNDAIRIANGGDISFYEDTGTTAKFFWDASAESLGIGTNSPGFPLVVQALNPRIQLLGTGTNTGISGLLFADADTNNGGQINYNHTDNSLDVVVNGAERIRIKSDGAVGFGTQSPVAALHINKSGMPQLLLDGGSDTTGDIVVPTGEKLQIGHWTQSTTTYVPRITVETNGTITFSNRIAGTDIQLSGAIERTAHNNGHLEGSYNSVEANSTKTNPIYSIGSSYNPNEDTLNNFYGIGFSHNTASFLTGDLDAGNNSGWGLYVAADGDARIFLNGTYGIISSTGQHYADGSLVWNAGNDGAGSGLDADTLDTLQSTQFLRSDEDDSLSGSLTVNKDGDSINLRSTTNAAKVGISFSSNVPASQIGHLRFAHADNDAYGSGALLELGSTESTTTILADGKLMYDQGIYSKPASGTGAGTRKDANWDAAYTYSQVDHIPKNSTTSGTGSYSTTGSYWEIKGDGGGVAMTTNDGHGNANITFNHRSGVPDQNGSSARIETGVDTSGPGSMTFSVSAGAVTSGTAVTLTTAMIVSPTEVQIPDKLSHIGDTDTYFQFHGANLARMVVAGAEVQEWGDNYTLFSDNDQVRLGTGSDFRMWFDATNTYFRNYAHAGGNIYFQGEDTEGSNHALLYMMNDNTQPYLKLYQNGGERLRTLSGGVGVTGLTVGDVDANPHNAGGLQVVSATDEKIVLSGSSNPHIRFQEGTTDKAYIQWSSSGFLDFRNQETGDFKFQSNVQGQAADIILVRNDTTTVAANRLGGIFFQHTDGDTNYPTITVDQSSAAITAEPSETVGTSDDGSRLNFYTKPTNTDKAVSHELTFMLDQNKRANFYGNLTMPETLYHTGDEDTYINFADNQINLNAGGSDALTINSTSVVVRETLDVNASLDLDASTNASNAGHFTLNVDNGNASYNAVVIDLNISGSTATTTDRTYSGLRIDADSSFTGGNTTDEGRLYAGYITANQSGDCDIVRGLYSLAQNTGTEAGTLTQTSELTGVYGYADQNRAGLVANMYGVYGYSVVDNAGATATVNATSSYGVYGKHLQSTGGTSGTTTNAIGLYGEVECDEGVITSARAVQAHIDKDEGAITTAYLFYGTYAGSPTTKHGLYLTGDTYNSMAGSLTVLNGLTVGDSGDRTTGPHNADGIQILSTNDEKMVLTGSTQPYIRWQEGTADKAFIRWLSSGQLHFNNQETGTFSFESNSTSAAVRLQFQASDADIYGTVYGTHSNEMGFLDQDGNWTVRCIRDDETRIMDNNIVQVAIGAGATGMGDYGTMTTGTTDGKGGYEGYGIGNRFVFMSSSTTLCGIYNDGNNEWCSQYRANAEVRLYHNGVEKFRTRSDGCQSNAFFYSSDERLKENIVTIDDSINKIKQLRGVEYDWKKSGKRDIGVIAQEVEQVIPEVVSTVDGKDEYVVEYGHMVGLLIEGIKEQQKEIDELKTLVKQLMEKK